MNNGFFSEIVTSQYSQAGHLGLFYSSNVMHNALHEPAPFSGRGSKVSSREWLIIDEMQHEQQVPVTPAYEQETGVPGTEDCRLNFSCELMAYSNNIITSFVSCLDDAPDEPGGRGCIGLHSVNEIRILLISL